jgi:hypothetical protein
VQFGRHYSPPVAIRIHERECADRDVDCARLGELHRLTHVLGEHQARADVIQDAGPLQRLPRRPSVRRVLGVRHRNACVSRLPQLPHAPRRRRSARREQHQHAIRVHPLRLRLEPARRLEPVDPPGVGGQEDVHRRALEHLHGQLPRRSERRRHARRVCLLERAHELRHCSRQIRRRGHQDRGRFHRCRCTRGAGERQHRSRIPCSSGPPVFSMHRMNAYRAEELASEVGESRRAPPLGEQVGAAQVWSPPTRC